MEDISTRLDRFRNKLKAIGAEAFIVPSGDPHFGEYFQKYYSSREWITGFTGSAGTAVVTIYESAMWTDSRYFVQAEKELLGSPVSLMRLNTPGTPSIPEWLSIVLPKGSAVGLDGSLFSVKEFDQLAESLPDYVIKIYDDPFSDVWTNRSALTYNTIRVVPADISGASPSEKLRAVCDTLAYNDKFLYIISSCDDICWLCNIRGEDIPYNPLPYSYAAFTGEKIYLFVSAGSLQKNVSDKIKESGIEVFDYAYFDEYIKNFDSSYTRIYYPAKTSVKVFESSVTGCDLYREDPIPGGVIASIKAVKNKVEVEGFRKSMIKDAVSWVKFWICLEESIKKGEMISETDLAKKIIEFRGEDPDYMGESFSPIIAFGANGALPHYSPFSGEPAFIQNNNFLLADTGAHYPYGTTDTTRTFAIGNLSEEQKNDYTAVVKGMINLSMAKFPKGTRGASLDFLARGAVCLEGKLYRHGTGHGIGHNLCVHEGPQSIRMEENPVALVPGMVISNEPAIYEEGHYGIRVENILLCAEWISNKFADFYQFETLTLIPIDKTALNKSRLGLEQIKWLNDYHKRVYDSLSPILNNNQREWLAEKTSVINC